LVHNIFHVPNYVSTFFNLTHVIEAEPLQLRQDLIYEKQLIEILDCREKQLHSKMVPLVKVLWANHTIAKATWEPEEEMRSKYPYLFVGIGM